MVVNGFEIPSAFVELAEAIERGEAPDEWALKEAVDAYGHPWEVADLRIKCDPEDLQEETDWISNTFLHEGRYIQPSWYNEADYPGFITPFTGVANFVQFADTTDGMAYAFDFGTDPKEPSVIYYEGYWRRVAPNFESFMALFVDRMKAPRRQPDYNNWEPVQPSPRSLLTFWVPQYVMADREDERPFFGELASDYAELSAEERREVEAEVREELERRGMTEEQRRTLDELWERLRATDQGR